MTYTVTTHPNKTICLVDMNQEPSHLFSDILIKSLDWYIKSNKKILIINNKTWYASGIICRQCGYIPKCTHCDIPISIHLDHQHLPYHICHICKTIYQQITQCAVCKSQLVSDYGMWNQKLAEWIADRYYCRSVIIDSKHTRSLTKIQKLHQQINQHTIIISTSVLIRPIPQWTPDLIIIFNADTWLQIPDRDSDRRQFQMIYELLVSHPTNHYLIQTHSPSHPVLNYISTMDPWWFDIQYQHYLQSHHYPPYGELCLIIYRSQIEDRLFSKINTLYQDLLYLREKMWLDIEIYATPPLIYKIYDSYRYHIIIKGIKIRDFVDQAYSQLDISRKWFYLDWMPVSLLG